MNRDEHLKTCASEEAVEIAQRVLHLPRSQWLAIHPDEHGLLCAACILKRIKDRLPGATVVHVIAEVTPSRALAPDPSAALRALVEQWNEAGILSADPSRGLTLQKCANELAAILASTEPT